MQLPNNPSESLKRRNPDLYPPVGAVATGQREQDPRPALDQKPKPQPRRKGGVVVRCSLIACCHRVLDDDNAIAGLKALRDAIARMFGLDDADGRIRFEYGQCRTDGEEGTIVRIERLK